MLAIHVPPGACIEPESKPNKRIMAATDLHKNRFVGSLVSFYGGDAPRTPINTERAER